MSHPIPTKSALPLDLLEHRLCRKTPFASYSERAFVQLPACFQRVKFRYRFRSYLQYPPVQSGSRFPVFSAGVSQTQDALLDAELLQLAPQCEAIDPEEVGGLALVPAGLPVDPQNVLPFHLGKGGNRPLAGNLTYPLGP